MEGVFDECHVMYGLNICWKRLFRYFNGFNGPFKCLYDGKRYFKCLNGDNKGLHCILNVPLHLRCWFYNIHDVFLI
jgi:hypothetical protein